MTRHSGTPAETGDPEPAGSVAAAGAFAPAPEDRNASFAFTEEFSVFLLVVMTLAGASAGFARNRHIRMEYFVGKLPPRAHRAVEVLVTACGAALFALVAWYGVKLFLDDWQYGTTSPGIGVPQWLYTVWLPVFSAMIALRIAGRLARLLALPR